MIPALRKVRTTIEDLRIFQDAVGLVLQSVVTRPILDGVMIEEISLVGTVPQAIDHKLGRKVRGWIVVRKSATADIWDLQDTNVTPTRSLILEASADVTISVWVF